MDTNNHQKQHEYNKMLAATIKRLREEKGLTQKDLAESIGCTREEIGRIERMKKIPYAHTLQAIVSALGYTLDEFASLMHGANMQSFDDDFTHLWDIAFAGDYVKMAEMLDVLKSKPYCDMDNPLVKQTILLCDANLLLSVEKDFKACVDMLCKALLITAPNLLSEIHTIQHEKISDTQLTFNEYCILNMISIAEKKLDNLNSAALISQSLVDALENETTLYRLQRSLLPTIYFNLSNTLMDMESYERALHYVERGLDFSNATGERYMLGQIFYNKGKSLYYLSKPNEVKIFFQKSHDWFVVTNQPDKADFVKSKVLEKYKIVLQ